MEETVKAERKVSTDAALRVKIQGLQRKDGKVYESVMKSTEALKKLGLTSIDVRFDDKQKIAFLSFTTEDLVQTITKLCRKKLPANVSKSVDMVSYMEDEYAVLRIGKRRHT